MGKARILGNTAKIAVIDPVTNAEVEIGEVDKFSAKNLAELKKSQPLGDIAVTSNLVHKGWDLSFEGGKVDWNLAALLHGQDEAIAAGKRAPQFIVKQKIKFFDGTSEDWQYDSVTIHGYEIDVPIEEITEKFSGFTGEKRKPLPTTAAEDKVSFIDAIIKKLQDEEDALNKKP